MPAFTTNYEGRDRLSHIEEYLSSNKSDSLNRFTARIAGRGLIAEAQELNTFPPNNTQASHGNAIATLVYIRAGDIISNIITYDVSAAGSNAIILPMLWDTSGTRLAVAAANASTAYSVGASSFVTSNLSSQYVAPADALVYVGLAISIAAGPKVLAAPTPALNMNTRLGSGLSLTVTGALTTSDATSVTFVANSTLGAPWAALS